MKYADALALTTTEWKAIQVEMDSKEEEQKAEALTTAVAGRLSRKRCKAKLVSLVKSGQVALTTPNALYAWTFGAATVDGANPEKIAGKQNPVLNISVDDWKKVTPERIAEVIQGHTTEKRAGDIILALMFSKKYKPSGEDVVFLTNERVSIEGVTAPTQQRKKFDLSMLLDGVTINN